MRLTGLRAFITPTAVYFGSALAIPALLCIPGQTLLSGALCVGAMMRLRGWTERPPIARPPAAEAG